MDRAVKMPSPSLRRQAPHLISSIASLFPWEKHPIDSPHSVQGGGPCRLAGVFCRLGLDLVLAHQVGSPVFFLCRAMLFFCISRARWGDGSVQELSLLVAFCTTLAVIKPPTTAITTAEYTPSEMWPNQTRTSAEPNAAMATMNLRLQYLLTAPPLPAAPGPSAGSAQSRKSRGRPGWWPSQAPCGRNTLPRWSLTMP